MMTEVEQQDSLAARIDSNKYSSYLKLTRVTARVLVLAIFQNCQKLNFRNAAKILTQADIAKAEVFWILKAQKSLRRDLKSGKFWRMCSKIRRDGVVVVGRHVERWVEMSYNQHEVPLLTQEHNISLLYDKFVHEQGHWGVSATANKVRARFWIIGLHRIAGEEHQAQLRSVQEIRP